MKLKGNMTLELTDVNTSEVTTITEGNMVTNAINNIFGLNPTGIFYDAGDSTNAIKWGSNFLPICPNLIGGILMFPKTLNESADNIYASSDNMPVAYASNDVNSTANLARGSLNLTESKAIDNGYKFVWEFTPSQGNGTIAAVALTSKYGGMNAYGSAVNDATVMQTLKSVKHVTAMTRAQTMLMFEAVEVNFEENYMISITYENTSVRIRKVHIPIFTIGINEKLDDTTVTVLEDQVIRPVQFKFLGSYTKYGEFMDGGDGYWYGFSNEANASGNATMLWIKISKADYSFTEGSWILSNAKLMEVGKRNGSSTYADRYIKCCIRKGYLYVFANDKKGIYKINLVNSADVTLLEFGFTSKFKPLCDSGTCEVYLTLIGDLIVGGDFQITIAGQTIQTLGGAKSYYLATPLFQYKNFLLGWGGSYGSDYRSVYLLTPYLATINNLSSAVVKTVDKTMKITYTLTQE